MNLAAHLAAEAILDGETYEGGGYDLECIDCRQALVPTEGKQVTQDGGGINFRPDGLVLRLQVARYPFGLESGLVVLAAQDEELRVDDQPERVEIVCPQECGALEKGSRSVRDC